MKLRTLKSVWLVMHNEWHSTITKPLFWYATFMTPLILFTIYLLFQWALGEDPREVLLKEDDNKGWRFFLEQELYGSRGDQTTILNYAILDSNEELVLKIHDEILKNDWYLFLLAVLEMKDEEFDSVRTFFTEGNASLLIELQKWKRTFEELPIEQLVAQLVGFLPPSDRMSNVDVSRFQVQLENWWKPNLKAVQRVVPELSTNFFNDITPPSANEDDVDSMLAAKEIIGYFVIPEDVGTDGANLTFVARVDTPRGQFLDLVNWFRSVGSDVLHKQRFEKLGIDPNTQQLLLLRANFATNEVVAENSSARLVPKSFYQFIYVALPILLFLIFFVSSLRLVANVVEEKSSKLADSLLANLSPINLLDGKLWGTALTSLTVAALWTLIIPIFVIVAGRWSSNVDPTIIGYLFQPVIVFNFLLFLFLAYALYGYFVVALTSRFSRLNNALSAALYVQGAVFLLFVLPTIIVPFIPFKFLQDVLSFFPLSTPFVLVARSGSLPDWPVYCAVVFVLVLCVLGSRALSGNLFAQGITDELRVSTRRRKKVNRRFEGGGVRPRDT